MLLLLYSNINIFPLPRTEHSYIAGCYCCSLVEESSCITALTVPGTQQWLAAGACATCRSALLAPLPNGYSASLVPAPMSHSTNDLKIKKWISHAVNQRLPELTGYLAHMNRYFPIWPFVNLDNIPSLKRPNKAHHPNLVTSTKPFPKWTLISKHFSCLKTFKKVNKAPIFLVNEHVLILS